VDFKPDFQTLLATSKNLHVCMKGPLGLGDGLVTLALLHGSLSWTRSTWIGFQHVLAFRWASAVAHVLSLHLQRPLNIQVMESKNGTDNGFIAIAVVIQVVAVFLLFIPRFAARQPFSMLFVICVLAICFGLSFRQVEIDVPIANQAQMVLGQLFVVVMFFAVFFSGGIGISFTMFAVAAAAQVNAPWLKKLGFGVQ